MNIGHHGILSNIGPAKYILLEPNEFELDGSNNILKWKDTGNAGIDFIPVPGLTARAVKDTATGGAIFATGDVLRAARSFGVNITTISCFVRVRVAAQPSANQFILGSWQTSATEERAWSIYNATSNRTLYAMSPGGFGGANQMKVYYVPTNFAVDRVFGFVMSGPDSFKWYDNGAETPGTVLSTNYNIAVNQLFNNLLPITIGYPLTNTNVLQSSWVAPNYTVKKVFVKLGVATPQEIAAM